MTNNKTPSAGEIVAALRIHADTGALCGGCPYDDGQSNCGERLTAAADLIEALQAENAELRKRLKTKQSIINLQDATVSLQGIDRDEAIRRMRDAEADLARVTAERDALLKYVPRECNTCKYWHRPEGTSWCDAPEEGPCHAITRELWQWRGPQKED